MRALRLLHLVLASFFVLVTFPAIPTSEPHLLAHVAIACAYLITAICLFRDLRGAWAAATVAALLAALLYVPFVLYNVYAFYVSRPPYEDSPGTILAVAALSPLAVSAVAICWLSWRHRRSLTEAVLGRAAA